MKTDGVCMFLMIVAMLCFLTCAILYAISGHWLIAALYMTCTSIEGLNAFLYLKRWLRVRQLMKECNE